MSERIRRAWVFLLFGLTGCSNWSGGVTPHGGFNYEKVSYDAEPIKNPIVIKVPITDIAIAAKEPVIVNSDVDSKQSSGLAIEGELTFATQKDCGGVVFVQLSRDRNANGQRVTAAGMAQCKVLDKRVTYHVEFPFPSEAGIHHLEVRLMHPPTSATPFPIAQGEIKMR